jgi:hypothetical protein
LLKRLRSLDITIFNSGWSRAVCVVEVKHYSANQKNRSTPPLVKLTNDLSKDYKRHGAYPGHVIPLIQIGLFTEIFSISPEIPKLKRTAYNMGYTGFSTRTIKKHPRISGLCRTLTTASPRIW